MIIFRTDKDNEIIPTRFPDNSQQVWKLQELIPGNEIELVWYYENDGELVTLAQTIDLITNIGGIKIKRIFIPFLPYARQDKVISNNTTFGLNTFTRLLSSITKNIPIESLDIHNHSYNTVKNIIPSEYILSAIISSHSDVVCFPDKGACDRYKDIIPSNIDIVTVNKIRNQDTGEIIKTELNGSLPHFSNILIVDDICDGGATFINVARVLSCSSENNVINLYTTHGIYSKGINNLLDNGIDNLYSTDSIKRSIKSERLIEFKIRR